VGQRLIEKTQKVKKAEKIADELRYQGGIKTEDCNKRKKCHISN
jgi:hypothetical protein